MKNILLITLLSGIIAGCSKLEETPYDQTFASTYYTNAAEAESAVVAMYGSFQDLYGGQYPLIAETAGDLMFPRNVVGRSSLTLYTYEPTYSIQQGFGRGFESPQAIWQAAYQCIEKANWIIDRVPSTNMTAIRRDEIIGEALFMRALMHWNLTKNFGDVPLKLQPSNSLETAVVGKSGRSDIYKSIFSDLDRAATLLPDYGPNMVRGRASRQAAQLLHAKTALYNEEWNLALTKSKELINAGRNNLANMADLFDVAKKDQPAVRQEMILACEANGNVTPPQFSFIAYLVAPLGATPYSGGGAGGFYVYQSFYNSFHPSDKRRMWLDTSYVALNGTVVPQRNIDTRLASRDLVILGKYKDPRATGAFNNNLVPVLRSADAYLIAAEAEARLAGPTATAYQMLNTIRQRAGVPDLQAGLSKDDFIDAVLQERAWEFYGEGDRWFDLTRTNKFLTLIPLRKNADYPSRVPQPKHRYFPIPQVEISANPKLTQNPQWQ